ncbi:MAG: DUF3137 domain-containing protein [Crocinitomicaceae bacterium]|nr:MAG: DUF3137 domain-containing protein [Crocinitomicaceae bacterium]
MNPELESLFTNGLTDSLNALNAARRKLISSFVLTICMSVLILVLIFLFNPFLKYFSCVVFLIFSVALLSSRFRRQQKKYQLQFKNLIISPLTQLVEGDLKYQPESGIDLETFKLSKLVKGPIDKFHSEDLFTGAIGETSFQFSEIVAKEKQDSESCGNSHITAFKGLFLVANFNKTIKSKLTVFPDVFAEKWGFLGEIVSREIFPTDGMERIKLEDSSFEKCFEVFGDDQVESRYILTPSLMRRFVELRDKKQFFGASFRENQLFIVVYLTKDLFEPHVFRKTINMKEIELFLDYLTFMTKIVIDLNLNNRIYKT